MSKKISPEEAFDGGDSFLDIVANIVGILIILVVMIGAKIETIPVTQPLATSTPAETQAPPPPLPAAGLTREQQARRERIVAELRTAQAELNHLQFGGQQVLGQLVQLRQETLLRHAERTQVAYQVEVLKSEVEKRRQRLSVEEQRQFDAGRQLTEAQRKVERLQQELAAVSAVPAPVVQIEHTATPLSRTVFGQEEYFQLSGNRILYVPKDRLIELVKADLERQAWKLRSSDSISAVLGPVDGFKIEFDLARRTIPGQGTMIEVSHWSMIPVNPEMGEPIEEALNGQSRFREILKELNPRRVTITLWVYPDSFRAFRELQSELLRLGFTYAARPLPPGLPISGSPYGTRSSAQ